MRNRRLLSIIVAVIVALNVINIAKHIVFYNSPEKAYKAIYNREVYVVVEGKKTVLVIGEKEPVTLKKVGDKYIYPMKSSEVMRAIKNIDDYVICVYEYGEMNEYYMTISAFEGSYPTIEDNRNNIFHRVVELNERGEGTSGYFAYIDGLDKDYEITIDGKSVKMFE